MSDVNKLRTTAYETIGPNGEWGEATLFGRLSGIRTQNGYDKVNDGLIAKKFSRLFGVKAGSAPSLRVKPRHLPYN